MRLIHVTTTIVLVVVLPILTSAGFVVLSSHYSHRLRAPTTPSRNVVLLQATRQESIDKLQQEVDQALQQREARRLQLENEIQEFRQAFEQEKASLQSVDAQLSQQAQSVQQEILSKKQALEKQLEQQTREFSRKFELERKSLETVDATIVKKLKKLEKIKAGGASPVDDVTSSLLESIPSSLVPTIAGVTVVAGAVGFTIKRRQEALQREEQERLKRQQEQQQAQTASPLGNAATTIAAGLLGLGVLAATFTGGLADKLSFIGAPSDQTVVVEKESSSDTTRLLNSNMPKMVEPPILVKTNEPPSEKRANVLKQTESINEKVEAKQKEPVASIEAPSKTVLKEKEAPVVPAAKREDSVQSVKQQDQEPSLVVVAPAPTNEVRVKKQPKDDVPVLSSDEAPAKTLREDGVQSVKQQEKEPLVVAPAPTNEVPAKKQPKDKVSVVTDEAPAKTLSKEDGAKLAKQQQQQEEESLSDKKVDAKIVAKELDNETTQEDKKAEIIKVESPPQVVTKDEMIAIDKSVESLKQEPKETPQPTEVASKVKNEPRSSVVSEKQQPVDKALETSQEETKSAKKIESSSEVASPVVSSSPGESTNVPAKMPSANNIVSKALENIDIPSASDLAEKIKLPDTSNLQNALSEAFDNLSSNTPALVAAGATLATALIAVVLNPFQDESEPTSAKSRAATQGTDASAPSGADRVVERKTTIPDVVPATDSMPSGTGSKPDRKDTRIDPATLGSAPLERKKQASSDPKNVARAFAKLANMQAKPQSGSKDDLSKPPADSSDSTAGKVTGGIPPDTSRRAAGGTREGTQPPINGEKRLPRTLTPLEQKWISETTPVPPVEPKVPPEPRDDVAPTARGASVAKPNPSADPRTQMPLETKPPTRKSEDPTDSTAAGNEVKKNTGSGVTGVKSSRETLAASAQANKAGLSSTGRPKGAQKATTDQKVPGPAKSVPTIDSKAATNGGASDKPLPKPVAPKGVSKQTQTQTMPARTLTPLEKRYASKVASNQNRSNSPSPKPEVPKEQKKPVQERTSTTPEKRSASKLASGKNRFNKRKMPEAPKPLETKSSSDSVPSGMDTKPAPTSKDQSSKPVPKQGPPGPVRTMTPLERKYAEKSAAKEPKFENKSIPKKSEKRDDNDKNSKTKQPSPGSIRSDVSSNKAGRDKPTSARQLIRKTPRSSDTSSRGTGKRRPVITVEPLEKTYTRTTDKSEASDDEKKSSTWPPPVSDDSKTTASSPSNPNGKREESGTKSTSGSSTPSGGTWPPAVSKNDSKTTTSSTGSSAPSSSTSRQGSETRESSTSSNAFGTFNLNSLSNSGDSSASSRQSDRRSTAGPPDWMKSTPKKDKAASSDRSSTDANPFGTFNLDSLSRRGSEDQQSETTSSSESGGAKKQAPEAKPPSANPFGTFNLESLSSTNEGNTDSSRSEDEKQGPSSSGGYLDDLGNEEEPFS